MTHLTEYPHPWHFGPMLALDLETTSADPEEARIVQVGGATINGPKVTPFSYLVNPLVPIPADATAIHGITDEQVMRDGISGQQAGAALIETLGNAAEAGLPVLIFNAPFDLTVIDRELERWGMVGLDYDHMPPIIDGLTIARRCSTGPFSLAAQCEKWRVPTGQAHDASADAFAAARLVWRLAEECRVAIHPEDRGVDLGFHGRNVKPGDPEMGVEVLPLKDVPMDVLQRAQATWYQLSAEGFLANQREKGRDPVVNYQWPVIRRLRAVS